ncbi:MAG TPA: hypothetical protein VF145_12385 [Chitinophagaceae bacterium]
MKKYITNSAKLLLAIGMLVPAMAALSQETPKQDSKAEDEKFTYGTPAFFRPYSQNGIGVFETSKADFSKPYEGKKIRFGAGFTMQFQGIKHENAPTTLGNTNKLWKLTPGFMTAQANLFIDVQLADGVSMNVTNYMSARHHNEFWVKGGYFQLDKLPFIKSDVLDNIMKYATIKVGHMEINYGDAHFRRPDGGATLQSPFMEGNIMDAFATEIGGEVYFQKNGMIAMVGLTNGMIKGHVDSTFKTAQDDNTKRNPSIYGKLGIDKSLGDQLRFRLTGSIYTNSSQAGSGITLYSGDRTGSNYQNVMEVEKKFDAATNSYITKSYTDMYSSGRFNPGFSKKITAIMVNAFMKAYGFEFFGTYENAKGRSKTETAERKANQFAVEGLYRFGKSENFYIGARYNKVNAELMQTATTTPALADVSIDRTAFAAGWFLTKNVLMKAEYVTQNYNGFLGNDFRNGGKFKGYVIEAIVGF